MNDYQETQYLEIDKRILNEKDQKQFCLKELRGIYNRESYRSAVGFIEKSQIYNALYYSSNTNILMRIILNSRDTGYEKIPNEEIIQFFNHSTKEYLGNIRLFHFINTLNNSIPFNNHHIQIMTEGQLEPLKALDIMKDSGIRAETLTILPSRDSELNRFLDQTYIFGIDQSESSSLLE